MNKILFLLPTLLACSVSQVQSQPNADERKADVTTPVKPPAMTKTKILSWLTSDKHVDTQRKIINTEAFSVGVPHTVSKDYPTVLQQLAAIESAGALKDKELIPALLDYADYIAPDAVMPPSFWAWNTIEWRQKRYPALKALLQIHSADGLSAYIEADHSIKKRASALSVLREIDYDKAVELGGKLLEDPEVKKDDTLRQWIHDLMQKEVPPPKLTLSK